MPTPYEMQKLRLNINTAGKPNRFSMCIEHNGTEKPEPDYWSGSKVPPKPAIQEDLSRFAGNAKQREVAKGWCAKLTPAQRKREVAKRRKNGAAGRVKR